VAITFIRNSNHRIVKQSVEKRLRSERRNRQSPPLYEFPARLHQPKHTKLKDAQKIETNLSVCKFPNRPIIGEAKIGITNPMKNYLITIFNTPESEQEWADMTPEQMQAGLAKYMAYSEKLKNGNHMITGEGLSMNGNVLKAGSNGVEVTDGPYILAKELIGGFFFIQAESLAEATALAKDCPAIEHGATVEVREQMDYGQ
jgi:hypothetical protein